MSEWALAQGMTQQHVALLTDRDGPIRMHQIVDAVLDVIRDNDLEQLVIYFAGHGLNLFRSEFWLLSRAPDDANEFVNVELSVNVAWTSGIPNVVLISDACRTVPITVAAQTLAGGCLFPNNPADAPEGKVDRFFATRLGDPATEIRGFRVPNHYDAVYSALLIDALRGTPAKILDRAGPQTSLVRTRRLADFLEREVPVAAAPHNVSQRPIARISSDENSWLSLLNNPAGEDTSTAYSSEISLGYPQTPEVLMTDATTDFMDRLLSSAMSGDVKKFERDLASADRRDEGIQTLVTGYESAVGRPSRKLSGPSKAAGIEVSGAVMSRLYSGDQELTREGNVAFGDLGDIRACSVLLELNGEACVIVPTIAGMLCRVHFADNQIVHISYEPYPSERRKAVGERPADKGLTILSAVAATAARFGFLELARAEGEQMSSILTTRKKLDLSLALYSAYAFNSRGEFDKVRWIARRMGNDFGFQFLDFALLASPKKFESLGKKVFFTWFPMLAQGWSLTSIAEKLDAKFSHLLPYVKSSVWTMFDPEAWSHLERIVIEEPTTFFPGESNNG
jgi:hypothetical protein